MTKQPPFELIQQWVIEIDYDECNWLYEINIANRAAQWGANEELEACCEYLRSSAAWEPEDVQELFDHCRPKPPSLNDMALKMLDTIERDAHYLPEITDTIRRALLSNIDDFNKIPQK